MNRYSQQPNGLLVPAHVNLGAPRVVHCKKERHHVDVGRPTKWGNPFVIGKHSNRAEVIELYEQWLYENKALMAALGELRGMVLGCWCAPLACHGDVLVRLANGYGMADLALTQ